MSCMRVEMVRLFEMRADGAQTHQQEKNAHDQMMKVFALSNCTCAGVAFLYSISKSRVLNKPISLNPLMHDMA
jgi:hypothetical protein